MKLKYHSPIAYPVTRSNRYVAAGTPTPFIVSLGESKGERVLYLPVSSNTPSIFLLFRRATTTESNVKNLLGQRERGRNLETERSHHHVHPTPAQVRPSAESAATL